MNGSISKRCSIDSPVLVFCIFHNLKYELGFYVLDILSHSIRCTYWEVSGFVVCPLNCTGFIKNDFKNEFPIMYNYNYNVYVVLELGSL